MHPCHISRGRAKLFTSEITLNDTRKLYTGPEIHAQVVDRPRMDFFEQQMEYQQLATLIQVEILELCYSLTKRMIYFIVHQVYIW